MGILEELWYGNVAPTEMAGRDDPAFKKQNGLVLKNWEDLQGTLTDLQKEKLDKYCDSAMELSALGEKQAFVYAFRLGAQIMLEMLQDIK